MNDDEPYVYGSMKFASGEETLPTRTIPKGHDFNHKALKPLARSLWSCSVAQGHLLTAYRNISSLKSTTISPDGLVGGRGYAMSLLEIRRRLHEAAESLSAITDALYDETTAPHWKPKLSQLDPEDRLDFTRFIEDSQRVLDDPTGNADQSVDDFEKAVNIKTAGPSSSIPVSTLSGPRVEHVGPGDNYNLYEDEPFLSGPLKDYAYDSIIWDGKAAASSIPDTSTEATPTGAHDFGIGYSTKGLGIENANPAIGDGGYGVLGPTSGLPSGGPSGVTYSESDLAHRVALRWASSLLPQDATGSAARSDYYQGLAEDNLTPTREAASQLPETVSNLGVSSQNTFGIYQTEADQNRDTYVIWDGTTKTQVNPHGEHPGQDGQEPWAVGGDSTR